MHAQDACLEEPALVAPGRSPLAYGALRAHLAYQAGSFLRAGLEPGDHIALVLPNSAETVVSLLAAMSFGTCAPLNPSLTTTEFEFEFEDLRVDAVIVDEDAPATSVDAAERLNIKVLRLLRSNKSAGVFEIMGNSGESCLVEPAPDDVALVMHTSGTTARPKIVPLTHRMLCASAINVARSLALSCHDRYLGIMPLYHIHGLATLLSALAAGSTVIASKPFDVTGFWELVHQFQPTWYSAAPTLHQAILSSARGRDKAKSLRFVRSASAALPIATIEALERTLGVPVIEFYGMTEASDQISSNPLPPLVRKAGSVGRVNELELSIVDASNKKLAAGERGEIILRGTTVITAYERNPDANISGFQDGWFRTGDIGYLDEDGYLFLTGRIKEIINRGGEKISPREVDEVLMRYPGVRQAVTFALPHPKLGESVAAAIVTDGSTIDTHALRAFAAKQLAPYKLPQRIVVVDRLPVGPTGKLIRIGLADKLRTELDMEFSDDAASDSSDSSDYLERQLGAIWKDVLHRSTISSNEDLFGQLGATSLEAVEVINRISQLLGRQIDAASLLAGQTIAGQARLLQSSTDRRDLLIPLKHIDQAPTLFLLPPASGQVFPYVSLARLITPQFSVFALKSPELDLDAQLLSLPEIVRRYVERIQTHQPTGPYYLGGWSYGATLAFEAAYLLEQMGARVEFVYMLEPLTPISFVSSLRRRAMTAFTQWLALKAPSLARRVPALRAAMGAPKLLDRLFLMLPRYPREGDWRRVAEVVLAPQGNEPPADLSELSETDIIETMAKTIKDNATPDEFRRYFLPGVTTPQLMQAARVWKHHAMTQSVYSTSRKVGTRLFVSACPENTLAAQWQSFTSEPLDFRCYPALAVGFLNPHNAFLEEVNIRMYINDLNRVLEQSNGTQATSRAA